MLMRDILLETYISVSQEKEFEALLNPRGIVGCSKADVKID